MPAKPFFEDADSSFFDSRGMPIRPGIYEFHRFDGRKILYTLEFMDGENEAPPRLKVVHASRMEDYPYPAHALNALEGSWMRFLGLPASSPEAGEAPEGPSQGP